MRKLYGLLATFILVVTTSCVNPTSYKHAYLSSKSVDFSLGNWVLAPPVSSNNTLPVSVIKEDAILFLDEMTQGRAVYLPSIPGLMVDPNNYGTEENLVEALSTQTDKDFVVFINGGILQQELGTVSPPGRDRSERALSTDQTGRVDPYYVAPSDENRAALTIRIYDVKNGMLTYDHTVTATTRSNRDNTNWRVQRSASSILEKAWEKAITRMRKHRAE